MIGFKIKLCGSEVIVHYPGTKYGSGDSGGFQSELVPDEICENFNLIKGDKAERACLRFTSEREAEFGAGILTWMAKREVKE